MVFFWFNISRLFISHTYIQNFLHFNSPFSPLALLPLYIYLPIVLHVIPCQIHKQKQCHLPSIFWQYLPSSNIVVSSNPNPYELATTKKWRACNYDFDVKVKHCGFVGFENDVIDCGFLGYVFYFRIKEKEKYTISTFTL